MGQMMRYDREKEGGVPEGCAAGEKRYSFTQFLNPHTIYATSHWENEIDDMTDGLYHKRRGISIECDIHKFR